MTDLMVKAQWHMNAEDTLSTRGERDTEPSSQSDKRKREQQQAQREERGGRAKECNNNNRGIRPWVNPTPSRF